MSVPVTSLETYLCDPRFFGLTTASPLQRAICRVADGLPLGALSTDPTVTAAIGDVAALPTERPKEIDVYSGIRTGKSLLAAAAAVRAARTVDVSQLGPGETARVSIVSVSTDLAQVVFDHLVGTIQARPALRSLLVEDPTRDSVLLKHPSGRAVEIKVVAGSRAGSSLVARWSAGVIFDEQPRMLSSEDGSVVNFDDALAAVEGRMLPGAQIVCIGSPWAPWGAAWESVEKDHGHPSRHKVVILAPAPAMNPHWWTAERCADLLEKNPRAYRTDVLAQFADAGGSALDADQIARTRRYVGKFTPVSKMVGFLDSSAGAGDAWTWCCAQFVLGTGDGTGAKTIEIPGLGTVNIAFPKQADSGPATPVLFLDGINAFIGAFRKHTTSDQVIETMALDFIKRGVTQVFGDGYQEFFITAALAKYGIRYRAIPWSGPSKTDAISCLRQYLADGTLVIEQTPEGDLMRRELTTLQQRLMPSGAYSFGARSAKHDDRAALAIGAAMLLARGEFPGAPLRVNRNRRILGGPDFQGTL